MDAREAAELAQLALVLWREARGEPREAKAAVAWSIITRADGGGWWWGHDVLTVIAKPYQYSSMTHPQDGQLTRWPTFEDASYRECLDVAEKVLNDSEPNPIPGADSYYDISISAPSWATENTHRGDIGRLRFYQVRPARPA